MTILKKFFIPFLFSIGITNALAAIETIVFTGAQDARLEISNQNNLATFNVCINNNDIDQVNEKLKNMSLY
ncbi:MAG: hypothetical protein V1855_03855 [bacterium]